MSNFKIENHETRTQFVQDMEVNKKYVVPVDTSVVALLKNNNQQNFIPNYSGDIVDMSNKSLMEINSMHNEVLTTIEQKTEEINYLQQEEKNLAQKAQEVQQTEQTTN